MNNIGGSKAAYQAPVSPYNDKNPMPQIDGVPIGAYGAQWGGTTSFDPSTNPRAQEWLKWMQKSDPSAHWQATGGSDGDGGQYQFVQDHPGAEGIYPDLQKALKPMGGGQTMENVFENSDWQSTGAKPHGYAAQVKNPNMMIHSPFGRITPTMNTSGANEDGLGKYAGMGIGLLATIMSGGAASPLLISMMTKAPGMLDSLSHYMQHRHGGGG
jgi:hypothetical protein